MLNALQCSTLHCTFTDINQADCPLPACLQLYLILAMADCGKDLEKASVPGYDQARSLLAQVGV
jgi:hypothetical protein